ncbi:efflux RND transporter periplasmic adaptor subunit, partial [Litorisediminicola beolgyonensis]
MRIFSILTALAVAAVLYALVFERDQLLVLAGLNDTAPAAETAEPQAEAAETPDEAPADAVRVIATRSSVEEVPSRVILRGETEPARQVDMLAETAGRVISDPLRKGTFVNAGDMLCELDPGTRPQSLEEAQDALTEARAPVPEAEARIPEAEAR